MRASSLTDRPIRSASLRQDLGWWIVSTGIALAGCDAPTQSSIAPAGDRSESPLVSSLEVFQNRPSVAPQGVQNATGMFVATKREQLTNAEQLPARLKAPDALVWTAAARLDLTGILHGLSHLSDLPFRLTIGPGNQTVKTTPVQIEDHPETESQNAPAQTVLNEFGIGQDMLIAFKGSLPIILNQVASHYDLVWHYAGGRIHFEQYTPRSYQIDVLPTSSATSSAIGSSATSVKLDLYQDIQTSLKELLGDGGHYVQLTGAGTVLVNAKPSDHELIARFIRQINANLGQQIAIDVNILTVTLGNTQGFGANLNVFAGQKGETYLDLGATPSLSESSTFANVGIIREDLEIKAFLGLLNKVGQVNVETRTGATTSNNRIVPIQVIREVAYAKAVDLVTDGSSLNQTRITPGQVSTGFTMTILPRVLNNLEILLHYNIRLSDLHELKEFTSNNQRIQLPNVATTVFEQQTILGNGETLVLAGFERDRIATNSKGSGFLGRSRKVETQRTATVLMIRPRLLKRKTF